MSSAKKILDEIRRGVASEILSQKIPWEKLSEPDLAELIKFTRDQPDIPESYNLLDYLFRISREKDLWFSVEVLANAAQYQKMSLEDRKSILLSMRKRLDQIKDKIAVEMPTDVNLRRYWIFESAYYAVNGATLNETGHSIDAVQNYQIARGIYEQLGLFQQADKYTDIIHKLNSHKTTRVLRNTGSLIPPQIQAQQAEGKKNGSAAAPVEPQKKNTQLPANQPVESQPLAYIRNTAPLSFDNKADLPAETLTEPQNNHTQLPASQPVESQPLVFIRNTAPLSLDNKVDRLASAAVQELPEIPLADAAIEPFQEAQVSKDQIQSTSAEPGIVPNQDLQRLAEQIQEQIEILTDTKMQVQLFLSRRSILAREVQTLEKKIENLKQKLERLEKKEKTQEARQQEQA